MSAEGKKKRGIAGQTNAKNIPWRYNGWAPDWQARKIGANHMPAAHSSGSVTMRGLIGGVLAAKLGFPMFGQYDRMITHAQPRCTHELFKDDDVQREAAE